jgi:hypothetical protein
MMVCKRAWEESLSRIVMCELQLLLLSIETTANEAAMSWLLHCAWDLQLITAALLHDSIKGLLLCIPSVFALLD